MKIIISLLLVAGMGLIVFLGCVSPGSPPHEPNGSPSLATPIDTSGILHTYLISVSDTEWFKFTATAGRTYCIQTYGSAATVISLFATNELTLLSSNSGGVEGANAAIVWTCLTGGVYYFRVTSPSGSAIAQYTVNVRVGSAILDLIYPAGEMPLLSSGDTLPIQWAYSTNSGNYVSLYVYCADSLAYTIGSSMSNYGRYNWLIPSSLTTSSTYRIKIVSNNDTSVNDMSDTFSISQISAALIVTSPSATSTWNNGGLYSIYWAYSGNPGSYVSIALYDSSSFVTYIAGNTYISYKYYSWTIPSGLPNSSRYRIKITSTSDTALFGYSAEFSITQAVNTLLITTPSATTSWSTGTSYYVYWSYTGASGGYVSLALYDSTSMPVTTITSGTYMSYGDYSWTIPSSLTTGKYRIKITSISDTTVSNMSSAFTITKVPSSVTITTPSSLTSWSTGSSYYIYWTYAGSPGTYVNLSLYDSTSALVTTITSSSYLSNEDCYWTIPSTVTTGKYRIKIASTSDTTINSMSSAFTITKVPSSITITTPSATTSWSTGTSYYIYWTYSGNPGTYVNLSLYDSTSALVTTIASSTYLSYEDYSWAIPSVLPNGKYRIKIASTSDTTINSMSSAFTIAKVPSSLTITTPSATSSWNTGISYYVYWTYTGSPGSYVSLTLYDSTSLVTTITASYSTSGGSYYWSVPLALPNSSKYRIKITSVSDTTITSLSSPFSISKTVSALSVTTPSTLTSWSTGASYYIYWTYTGSPGTYISLALFDSTTTQVATITSSGYLSNEDYYWTIPSSVTTGKYRIKIASTSDTTINAFSGAFTITKIAAGITVTTPSSTTSWSAGSSQTIFWAYTGTSCSYVNISLFDSTALAATIGSSVYLSTGYYSWSVPTTLSTSSKYQVKITCTSDTTNKSVSPYFTINNGIGQ